jgi:hypothetical protein
MYTTIKISARLKAMLNSMKLFENETYEQLVEDLLEDHMTLNPKFRKELEEARREYKKGKIVSFHEIKTKLKSE